MNYSILINEGTSKKIYVVEKIDDQQIFQLVGHIQKILHQSGPKDLIDEELVAYVKDTLGMEINLIKLVAEININKPSQDW